MSYPADWSCHTLSPETAEALMAQARSASERAYAPYSHFRVGAAVRTASGDVVCGANVENASYGLTLCAERVALAAAVIQGQAQGIQALAVWGADCDQGAITPCGACRQVMAEFLSPETPVIVTEAATGAIRQIPMRQWLPWGFGLPHTDSSAPGGPD
jgi:homotetrameric cytidine deaminase